MYFQSNQEGGKGMELCLVLFIVITMVWIMGTAILIDENKRLKADKQAWKNRYYAAAQIQLYDRKNP